MYIRPRPIQMDAAKWKSLRRLCLPKGGETELPGFPGDIRKRKPVMLKPGLNIVSTEVGKWSTPGFGGQTAMENRCFMKPDSCHCRLMR